ncbi:two-component response regulator-like APRR1 [Rutidosis leptorrhynchoides]|uniref:two-component response regulator-like APRR1 n=1 Tax=Rutidosis leptorrhynchoides TaxID=125765 RepID=UPI003A999BB5
MESNGSLLGKTGDGFIDRSKVRILLCDNDLNGTGEVFTLLCKCSYQVISVKSPRQVIDALNAEGPNIDIILSEVDLPMAKGLKMLKYIMRKELQRIPVIMMSAQDEVTLVVKCLRLGAADYLVKPLRTNELLNLWTHMWRRRRMLGLTEKKLINCEFDLVHSDHSDVNTNSTMFSDDTDEKSRKSSNPEISMTIHHTNEINVILAPGPADKQLVRLSNDRSSLPETNDRQLGNFMSGPKKSKLQIGQSSAFLTYVKERTTPVVSVSIDKTTPLLSVHKEPIVCHDVEGPPINLFGQNISEKSRPGEDTQENYQTQPRAIFSNTDNFHGSNSFPNSVSLDESSTTPFRTECFQQTTSNIEELRNNSHTNVPAYNNPHAAYTYYLQGAMNHAMMSSSQSSSMYHSPYPPHHMAGMTPFPYYPPVNLCIQPGQLPHPWPPLFGSTSSNDGKSQTVDRRQTALLKFRQKRKDRCFDKKIRYVNRKMLAERRPRIRGQFVRKVNGIDVDLNGHPTGTDFDDEDEDDEED